MIPFHCHSLGKELNLHCPESYSHEQDFLIVSIAIFVSHFGAFYGRKRIKMTRINADMCDRNIL